MGPCRQSTEIVRERSQVFRLFDWYGIGMAWLLLVSTIAVPYDDMPHFAIIFKQNSAIQVSICRYVANGHFFSRVI